MAAKAKPKKAKRKQSRPGQSPAHGASMLSMVMKNLTNMIAVCAVSGSVLLGLLAARHF